VQRVGVLLDDVEGDGEPLLILGVVCVIDNGGRNTLLARSRAVS
jgi:hypothetical protein